MRMLRMSRRSCIFVRRILLGVSSYLLTSQSVFALSCKVTHKDLSDQQLKVMDDFCQKLLKEVDEEGAPTQISTFIGRSMVAGFSIPPLSNDSQARIRYSVADIGVEVGDIAQIVKSGSDLKLSVHYVFQNDSGCLATRFVQKGLSWVRADSEGFKLTAREVDLRGLEELADYEKRFSKDEVGEFVTDHPEKNEPGTCGGRSTKKTLYWLNFAVEKNLIECERADCFLNKYRSRALQPVTDSGSFFFDKEDPETYYEIGRVRLRIETIENKYIGTLLLSKWRKVKQSLDIEIEDEIPENVTPKSLEKDFFINASPE